MLTKSAAAKEFESSLTYSDNANIVAIIVQYIIEIRTNNRPEIGIKLDTREPELHLASELNQHTRMLNPRHLGLNGGRKPYV